MEDPDFVTRLERSGQTADAAEPFRNRYFAAARLPRFSGRVRVGPIDPRGGSAEQWPAHHDRGCKAAPFKKPPLIAESGGATRAALLAMRAHRGTGSSNPLPSSRESANSRSLMKAHADRSRARPPASRQGGGTGSSNLLCSSGESRANLSSSECRSANFGVSDRRFRFKPAGGFGGNRQAVSVQSGTPLRMGFGPGFGEPPLRDTSWKAVLHPVACDQVPGARGRGQGTETLA
jgi:hypothetical protein